MSPKHSPKVDLHNFKNQAGIFIRGKHIAWFFAIYKATVRKTAIKSKFVDRFPLKNFRAAIDRYTVQSLNGYDCYNKLCHFFVL